MLRLLNFLSRHLKSRSITGPNDDLYLLRVRLFGWMPGDSAKPFSLYLHRFVREDMDRDLHSHPWKFAISFVLAGGYDEERLMKDGSVVLRRIKPFRFNILRSTSFHRVDKLHGRETWTLFFAGPKFGTWGFRVVGRGIVPWRQYLEEKNIAVDY